MSDVISLLESTGHDLSAWLEEIVWRNDEEIRLATIGIADNEDGDQIGELLVAFDKDGVLENSRVFGITAFWFDDALYCKTIADMLGSDGVTFEIGLSTLTAYFETF